MQSLKTTGAVTAVVFCVSWATEAEINRLAFGKAAPYHLASLFSAVIVGALFFVWRYRERHHYKLLRQFETERRRRIHLIRNKLNVIALCTSETRVRMAVDEIGKVIDEPILPKALDQSPIFRNLIPD